MQTILQIVRNVEMELGLTPSVSVYGTNTLPTDNTGIQMGALANRVLDELRRMNRWTTLQFEYDLLVNVPVTVTGDVAANSAVITNISPNTTDISAYIFQVSGPGIPVAARVLSVDSSTQVTMTMENSSDAAVTAATLIFAQDTYPMPTGFDWFINDTMWDRTNRWRLLGPDSPQLDQTHRSGIVNTGPRRHFRQIGQGGTPGLGINEFRIWPPPLDITAPTQLVFEYLSLAAVNVNGANTTFNQYFVNDDDTPLLDDQAIIQGIKWLFWEAKGFGSYVTMQSRWVDYVNRLIARDGGAPTLQIAKRVQSILINASAVQDGNYPGPSGPNTS